MNIDYLIYDSDELSKRLFDNRIPNYIKINYLKHGMNLSDKDPSVRNLFLSSLKHSRSNLEMFKLTFSKLNDFNEDEYLFIFISVKKIQKVSLKWVDFILNLDLKINNSQSSYFLIQALICNPYFEWNKKNTEKIADHFLKNFDFYKYNKKTIRGVLRYLGHYLKTDKIHEIVLKFSQSKYFTDFLFCVFLKNENIKPKTINFILKKISKNYLQKINFSNNYSLYVFDLNYSSFDKKSFFILKKRIGLLKFIKVFHINSCNFKKIEELFPQLPKTLSREIVNYFYIKTKISKKLPIIY